MKRYIPLILCACLLFSAVACSSGDQVFTHRELTLTLDGSFRLLDEGETSVSYASIKKMQTVTVSYEEKEKLIQTEEDSDMSLKEYGELCLSDMLAQDAEQKHESDKASPGAVKTHGEIVYFTYHRDADDVPYTCLATFHATEDAFYTVTFSAPEEEFDAVQNDFFDMAEEIFFVKNNS